MAEELNENTIAFDSLYEWVVNGWGLPTDEFRVVIAVRYDACRYTAPGVDQSVTRFIGPFLADEIHFNLHPEEQEHRELKAGGEAEVCDRQAIGWFITPVDEYSKDRIVFSEWNYLA